MNSLGLLLDIVGVLLLTFDTLPELRKMKIPRIDNRGVLNGNPELDLLQKVIEDLNRNLNQFNSSRLKTINRSKRYIAIIIFGFVLQLVAQWIGAFS